MSSIKNVKGFKSFKGILYNLNNQIITQLSEAGKAVLQEKVQASVKETSSVTGSFAKTYHKVMSNPKKRKNVTIGYFTKGYAEMLERGAESLYYKINKYPKFISFAEQPHLKTWVELKPNIRDTTRKGWLKAGGLTVGLSTTRSKKRNKIGGTRFGVGKNKWFTNAIKGFRKPYKQKGIEYMKTITINKTN